MVERILYRWASLAIHMAYNDMDIVRVHQLLMIWFHSVETPPPCLKLFAAEMSSLGNPSESKTKMYAMKLRSIFTILNSPESIQSGSTTDPMHKTDGGFRLRGLGGLTSYVWPMHVDYLFGQGN